MPELKGQASYLCMLRLQLYLLPPAGILVPPLAQGGLQDVVAVVADGVLGLDLPQLCPGVVGGVAHLGGSPVGVA